MLYVIGMTTFLVILRAVPGYSGYYVTGNGLVLSIKRGRPKFLSAVRFNNGYDMVMLFRDGHGKQIGIHRLVLVAWVGPCPPRHECCHLNGIRHDNRVENLRWDTRAGNFRDRDRHGTTARGERNGYSRLTDDAILDIRRSAHRGEPHARIAERHGVYQSTVSDIVAGKRWKHIGGPIRRGGYFRRARLTANDVREIRRRHAAGAKHKDLVREFGVSQPTISNIINHDTWKDVD